MGQGDTHTGATEMPGVGERRERRDAAAHRQRILDVARRLFAEQGVGAVSMHQIAQAAGIGQGTLYRRYRNKGDLCQDLMHEHYERFMAELHSLLADSVATPALSRLDEVLGRTLRFINDAMPLLEAVVTAQLREMRCDGPSDFLKGPPARHKYEWGHDGHTIIALLLNEAVTNGEVAPLDVDYTADLIMATINPMALHYLQQERGYTLDRIIAGMRHLFIRGMQPCPEGDIPQHSEAHSA